MLKQLVEEDSGSEEGGQNNGQTEGVDRCGNEFDGEIGKEPAEVGQTPDVDGARENGIDVKQASILPAFVGGHLGTHDVLHEEKATYHRHHG